MEQQTGVTMDAVEEALFDFDAAVWMEMYDARVLVGIPLTYEEACAIVNRNMKLARKEKTS